jgi:hypothetical protein
LEEYTGHHESVPFEQASIEHIMPQTLTPEWEEMLGPRAANIHAELLHTIGNLTLTGYNPELGNKSYPEKRVTFGLSHFELNRYFSDRHEWGEGQILDRASDLFHNALKIWPRPAISPDEKADGSDKTAPAAFHADCIRVAQRHLGVHVSKLSQTRYESGDGKIRVVCAVSAEHGESGTVPYYWFAVHRSQLDFLESAPSPWICLGCGSSNSTFLLPLSEIRTLLDSMSVTKTEERHYWHVVIQKKSGRFVLRLLGGKDGPEITAVNVGDVAQASVP